MTLSTPDGEVDAKVDGRYYSVVQANDYDGADRTYKVTYENGGAKTIATP